MTAHGPARLDDSTELLYRQVHPNHVPDAGLSKAAFLPTKAEELMLSTCRGRIGAEKAYDRWIANKCATVGSYGISVAEVDSTQFEDPKTKILSALHAVDDEVTQGPDHASVVFTALATKGQREQAARKLRDHAFERGCLHP